MSDALHSKHLTKTHVDHPTIPPNPETNATYASILRPTPVTPYKAAITKGDCISVKINKSAYEERLKLCQHSLLGRLVLSKGDKPWKLSDLKDKLQSLWQWRLIPLGKGYFTIILHSEEDRQCIWSMGSLHLNPGILRLQSWTPNFNPHKQKLTNTQVWVKIYDLPWEYWHRQILADIC